MKQPEIVVGGKAYKQNWFTWDEVKKLLKEQENGILRVPNPSGPGVPASVQRGLEG